MKNLANRNDPSAARDYKGRIIRKRTHLRYAERPDLAVLAVCTHLRGPVTDESYLTANEADVTCKRCRSIRGLPAVAS